MDNSIRSLRRLSDATTTLEFALAIQKAIAENPKMEPLELLKLFEAKHPEAVHGPRAVVITGSDTREMHVPPELVGATFAAGEHTPLGNVSGRAGSFQATAPEAGEVKIADFDPNKESDE